MRTQRTNGITTYNYVYNGSQLTRMTKGAHTMDFTYDASGSPLSVIHNGVTYYYVTNLQGDVVSIVNAQGVEVVTYSYDAWGNVLTTDGSMAMTLGHLNPLRYRGYVYDPETGLYYLQSRYYDPQVCRFINADAYTSTGQGLLGNNMFAYCNNNPINRIDPFGDMFTDIFPTYYGQGEASEMPSRLCIPNAKRTDTIQEMVEVTAEFLVDVITSDPTQDMYGIYKTVQGAKQLKTGVSTFLIMFIVPDPIPLVDEIVALWDVGYGFFRMVTGIGEFTDWEGTD